MTDKSGPRPAAQRARAGRGAPGGARIAAEQGRDGLTVPAVAARAGVTPSTIYRRWGDLSQLLADVAVEQLQPEQAPPDTGSFYGDLLAWLEQYFDEMSSVPGGPCCATCWAPRPRRPASDGFTRQQIEAIRERAIGRGEQAAEAEQIIMRVVAPLMYGVLFANQAPSAARMLALVREVEAARRAGAA